MALVGGGFLNNKNQNSFVGGSLDGSSSHIGLYLWSGGQLTPICVSGQTTMPGGGQFLGLVKFSATSSAGASAFTARLIGGDSGLYRVDADGHVSLIAKPSDLGAPVVFPDGSASFGLTINAQGQVALPVRFTGDKAESLVLLTPASPKRRDARAAFGRCSSWERGHSRMGKRSEPACRDEAAGAARRKGHGSLPSTDLI